jgi:hypothetical protein
MESITRKSCSMCGESFGCGINNNNAESCWCNELPRVEIVDGLDCYCPKCLARIVHEQLAAGKTGKLALELTEGVDYYLEGNNIVFTELYHLRRGYCCDSGCRHCPYEASKGTACRVPTK